MTNGGYMTREQVLATQDIRTEDVETPSGVVRVRELSAAEREWFEATVIESAAGQGEAAAGKGVASATRLQTTIVRMCAIDDQGLPLFTEADEEALGRKSSRFIKPLFAAVARLSGLGSTEAAVEKAEGFSEGTAPAVPS